MRLQSITCYAPECATQVTARGLCEKHYARLRKHGSLDFPIKPAERFWSRVDRSAGPHGCWPWLRHRTATGYGRVSFRGRLSLTHRLAYALTYGDIPDEMRVLHQCDNPPCCNPAHLFLGTQAANVADMLAKGRGPSFQGERNPRARLTADDVRHIRQRVADGARRGDLAAEYAVSDVAISYIVLRKAWAHID